MILYLVRHGQAQSNVDLDIYKTTPNPLIPLTQKGIKDAAAAADKIVQYMSVFAPSETRLAQQQVYLWSSTYDRAIQTAEIIHSKIGKCVHRKDVLLVEQNFGIAVGESSTEAFCAKTQEQSQLLFRAGKMYTALPQGESKVDVAVRAELFLQKISQMEACHIVVSHQGFCHMFHSQVTESYPSIWDWENGEIRRYKKEQGEFMKYEGRL